MRWITTLLLACACLTVLHACGGTGDNAGPASPKPRLWDSTTTPPAAAASPAPASSRLATSRGPFPGPLVAEVNREPVVRVRVQTNVNQLAIVRHGAIRVTGPLNRGTKAYRYSTPATITRDSAPGSSGGVSGGGGAWVIRDAAGQSVRWQLPELLIEADDGGVIDLGEKAYPRRLVLTPRTDKAGTETGNFDAVNHVPMETYLAGVIERELYGSWPLDTFKAQAVAARSYALWEMTIAGHRHYDLESTTASQAYIGKAKNPRAVTAVAETRGQCLTFAGRVVPAFYSSSSGGLGQDAVIAFPNRVEDIAPLRAREHGAWDKASPQYRWGPVVRDSATLARRIAAWGRDRPDPIMQLGKIAAIEVAARNRVGRPSAWAVTDTNGKRYTVSCEWFRNACNDTDNGRLPMEKGKRLLSSHFDVAVVGNTVRFTQGRGYGHGVGLSQWGAHGMAEAGHKYTAILQFYYPGAAVQKLY